ncbi:MAG: 4Fe-4S dicluster domain-containing protein [Proteobacteria bacterium]|nr:4Fe-4S dicluster domain-containing protein [Pseudomonadota bacterium]
MDVAAKLTKNAIKQDGESHILIDAEVCRTRCTERYCVRVCPAALYEWNAEADRVVVEHAGCLECGTCLVACREDALSWRYPRGGFGVQYRHG